LSLVRGSEEFTSKGSYNLQKRRCGRSIAWVLAGLSSTDKRLSRDGWKILESNR
jgi:hypothetical protein